MIKGISRGAQDQRLAGTELQHSKKPKLSWFMVWIVDPILHKQNTKHFFHQVLCPTLEGTLDTLKMTAVEEDEEMAGARRSAMRASAREGGTGFLSPRHTPEKQFVDLVVFSEVQGWFMVCGQLQSTNYLNSSFFLVCAYFRTIEENQKRIYKKSLWLLMSSVLHSVIYGTGCQPLL